MREKTKTTSSRRIVTIPPALLDRLRRHRAFIAEQAMAFGADYCASPFCCFLKSADGPWTRMR